MLRRESVNVEAAATVRRGHGGLGQGATRLEVESDVVAVAVAPSLPALFGECRSAVWCQLGPAVQLRACGSRRVTSRWACR